MPTTTTTTPPSYRVIPCGSEPDSPEREWTIVVTSHGVSHRCQFTTERGRRPTHDDIADLYLNGNDWIPCDNEDGTND